MKRFGWLLVAVAVVGFSSLAWAAPTKASKKKALPAASHSAKAAKASPAAKPAATPAAAPVLPAPSSFSADLRGKLEQVGVGNHVKLMLSADHAIAGKIVAIGPASVTVEAETGNGGSVEVASGDITDVVR